MRCCIFDDSVAAAPKTRKRLYFSEGNSSSIPPDSHKRWSFLLFQAAFVDLGVSLPYVGPEEWIVD